jgi:3-dehydroquinate synthetase
MVSTHLACRLGDCEESILSRLAVLLGKLGLPQKPDLPWEALVPHIALDKKFTEGRPRLVLPVSGSRCRLRDDIGLEMLRESYEEVGRWKSE